MPNELRPIDANSIKERLIHYAKSVDKTGTLSRLLVLMVDDEPTIPVSVMVPIENVPGVDVVDVVRCRNCVALKASVDGAYCDRLSSTWDKCYVRFDDFCSYGERKKNNAE